MDPTEIQFSIVIPTYRGAASLGPLVDRLTKTMQAAGKGYEIIIIDDDSPDDSWEVIHDLKNRFPMLRGFKLMSNVGQFRALMCGFDQVRGNFVITMDDDLQNPPEEIPVLVRAMQEHPEMDCIIGAYMHKEHSLWRRMGSALVSRLNRIISHKRADLRTTSFRLLRRNLVDAIAAHHTRSPVIGPLVIQNSKRIMNVFVDHHERAIGKSNYGLGGLIKLTLDHILNFSTLPLKVVSVIGILSSFFSICIGGFYLVRYLTTNIGVQVQGWTTIVLLLTFFSGMTLFSIGLIGEYLIRIIREVSHTPRYIIRDSF